MITDTGEILYGAWKGYVERFPSSFDALHDDLRFSCAGIPVALFNCAYPKRAVGREEFDGLTAHFSRMLASRRVPGLLMARADRVATRPGVEPLVRMPGMVARKLLASKFPAADVDVQHVRGEKMAEEIARLNVISHGMAEEEIGPMTCAGLWEAPNHGFLIYANAKAVASGSASYVNGASYVGWMATDAEYRGRGYAEALLRHMDAFMRREYGVTETVLHATELGRPVYERLGFKTVDVFVGFSCGEAVEAGG
jgi:GNAT superfamily N-acetyltransferase